MYAYIKYNHRHNVFVSKLEIKIQKSSSFFGVSYASFYVRFLKFYLINIGVTPRSS